MTYTVVEKRDEGSSAELAFVQDMAAQGWGLCGVTLLPTSFSRLDTNTFRYFFKRPLK